MASGQGCSVQGKELLNLRLTTPSRHHILYSVLRNFMMVKLLNSQDFQSPPSLLTFIIECGLHVRQSSVVISVNFT